MNLIDEYSSMNIVNVLELYLINNKIKSINKVVKNYEIYLSSIPRKKTGNSNYRYTHVILDICIINNQEYVGAKSIEVPINELLWKTGTFHASVSSIVSLFLKQQDSSERNSIDGNN